MELRSKLHEIIADSEPFRTRFLETIYNSELMHIEYTWERGTFSLIDEYYTSLEKDGYIIQRPDKGNGWYITNKGLLEVIAHKL